jgi:dephospho-CoA kinase
VLLLGLTGGIGSGKSTVASMLAERGAAVVDADRIARVVVEPDGPAYRPLIERFGPEIVRPDGALDRPAIAARVFNDPDALADLNAITHPAITDRMRQEIAEHAANDRIVVVDAALLDELIPSAAELAGVIVVRVAADVAVDRLVHQRRLSEDDARARIAAQAGRDERRAAADIVVDNSSDRRHLEREVDRVWDWISSLPSTRAS